MEAKEVGLTALLLSNHPSCSLAAVSADKLALALLQEGTVPEPDAAPISKAEDTAAEQQADAPPSKPPNGASSATNSPRAVQGSPEKGLGPRSASSNNGKVSAAGSEASLPPIHRQSSNLANRIAAFASGVAPVRRGITNADEDSITVEEVLHKLETAGRVGDAHGCDITSWIQSQQTQTR